MKVRRATWVLLALLGVSLTAAGAVLLRPPTPPAPVVLAPVTESSASRLRRDALSAMGPGRMLGKPASLAPESTSLELPTKTKTAQGTPDAAGLPGAPGSADGRVTTLTVTTPPFEVAKLYRSMEGPFAEYRVRLDGASGDGAKRELWWWKGASIEMLDEGGGPLDQEFMCHLNIDVDPAFRAANLGRRPHTPRLLTLTQGQMTFVVPKGRGLPVASDETWSIMFQVLNRSRTTPFRVKQRLRLFFVRDVDLVAPIDAGEVEAASLWVSVDKGSPDALRFDAESCHCCAPLGRALEATNNIARARTADEFGRAFVAHWTVPPGKSTWAYPLKRAASEFDPKGKRIHAMWTHVHPFAKEARITVRAPGCDPEVVARASAESLSGDRIGLVNIETVSSEAGIPLPEVGDYEMAVDYDNTSGEPQDSMTSIGLFLNDDGWKRPAWAQRAQNESGITESCASP